MLLIMKILLAVQTGSTINDPSRLTFKHDDFSMRSPEQMTELFKKIRSHRLDTVKIAKRCNLEIRLGKILLPKLSGA